MGCFATFDEVGRCITSGYCVDGQEIIQGGEKFKALATDHLISVSEWFLHGGTLKRLPEKPSINHVFDYELVKWVLDESQAWSAVRLQRDRLLAATDWRIARATELGQPLETSWKEYRQELRDISKQPDPSNIHWPQAPKEEA